MVELHKDNYDQEVIESKGVYLVDFWSDSCEECLELMPEVEALEEEFAGRLAMGKVNIKGNRRLAIREEVRGLPSLLLYRDGDKQAVFSKEFDIADVRAKIQELLGE